MGIIILIALGVFIWNIFAGFHNVPRDSGINCTMYGDCY